MKKQLLFFIFIAVCTATHAQNIGVNNPTPAASALLDLTSTNKGLLVPRVALTATNSNAPIGGSIVTSLLVYNTATAGTTPNNVTPGFYFWDSVKWIRLLGGSGTIADAWQTTGNAGTVDGTNFIGTTDNVPFNIRVNNSKAGRIDNTLGNAFYGFQSGNINTGAGNSFFGHTAGPLNTTGGNNSFFGFDAGTSSTTGGNNSFFGADAGFTNTTGNNNSFFGMRAGLLNSTGFSNVAVGFDALRSNTTTSNLVAVGDSALRNNTTGTLNTAVGSKAGLSNTIGAGNTYIGNSSGKNNTQGSFNTFIGYNVASTNVSGNSSTMVGSEAGKVNTGSDNSFFGERSGQANTSGGSNSFFGKITGFTNTTGSVNSFFGYSSGFSNTTGNNNSFFGRESGFANTTGFSNVAIGADALRSNTTTSNLVAVGDSALRANTGARNTAVGSKAGLSNTTGTDNSFFGFNAGRANTTGVSNVFIGRHAGFNNTTAFQNVFVGEAAGFTNTTGFNNTFIGTASGQVNSTGKRNVALGFEALNANSTGNANVAIGNEALSDNISISNLVAVGDSAMRSNTTGLNNTGVGSKAGFSNAAGHNNAWFGFEAGKLTTNSFNSFFGAQAGTANTTGTNNSFFGEETGVANVSGNGNAFFGQETGSFNTTGAGNSFFGRQSGLTNTTGNFNTLIGNSANVNANNLTNATAIGTNARVDASDAMVLGSVNGINNATATVKVGIGVNNPLDRLHVAGNIRMVDGSQAAGKVMTSDVNGTATWQTPGVTTITANNGLTMSTATNAQLGGTLLQNTTIANGGFNLNITGTGNVGIGTTAPVVKLDVRGAISILNNDNLSWGGAFGAGIPTIASTVGDGIYFYPTGSTSGIAMKINSSSNVGIGTTSPADKLHVVGNIRMVDGNQAAGKVLTSDASGTASWLSPGSINGWNLTGNSGTVDGTNFIGTTDNVPFNIRVNNQRSGRIDKTKRNVFLGYFSGPAGSTGNDLVIIGDSAGISSPNGNLLPPNGNTFVGSKAGYSTSPNLNLGGGGHSNTFVGAFSGYSNTAGISVTLLGYQSEVNGSGSLTNATAIGANARVDANNAMVLGSVNGINGATATVKVGIGTTTPNHRLEVRTLNTGEAAAYVRTDATTGTNYGIDAEAQGVGATANIAGYFQASGATNNYAIIVPAASGKVGIGTSAPIQQLEVAGQNVVAATSGAGQNGIARFQPTGSGFAMDVGASGGAPAHGWIQMRDNGNYATNFNLSLNPNGGNVGIGTTAPLITLQVGSTSSGEYGLQKGDASPNAGYLRFGDNSGWKFHIGRLRESIAGAVNTTITGAVMTVQDNGNVGIGTTSPAVKLDVNGSISILNNNDLTWGGAFGAGIPTIASTVGDGIYFYPTGSTSGAVMKINSSSNVGIGTTSPADKLHVVGNIRMVDGNQAAGKVMTSDANGTATWQASTGTAWGLTGNAGTVDGTNFIGTTDNIPFNIKVNNQKAGRIENTNGNSFYGYQSGNVNTGTDNSFFGKNAGIGNTAGIRNTFIGSFSGTTNISGNANTILGFGSGAGAQSIGSNNTIISSSANSFSLGSGNILLGSTGASSLVEAISSNNVLIGNGSSLIGPAVSGTTFSEIVLLGANTSYESSSVTITNANAIGNRAKVTANNAMVLGSVNGVNGATATVNVGIGINAPTQRLHVVGNGLFTGTVTASCGVLSCSDLRYKKDIMPLQNSLENIMQLQGVSYYWKKEEFPERDFNNDKQIGVIAQELEKIYPELVATDTDGYKTVDYSKLTPVLLEAIKELKNENDKLKSSLDNVQSKMLEFENRLNTITGTAANAGAQK